LNPDTVLEKWLEDFSAGTVDKAEVGKIEAGQGTFSGLDEKAAHRSALPEAEGLFPPKDERAIFGCQRQRIPHDLYLEGHAHAAQALTRERDLRWRIPLVLIGLGLFSLPIYELMVRHFERSARLVNADPFAQQGITGTATQHEHKQEWKNGPHFRSSPEFG
jgi:hypothetical protein